MKNKVFLYFLLLVCTGMGEYLQEFEISEGLTIGTTIGYIGQSKHTFPKPPPPPYLIVPVPGSAVDSDLAIDQSTGQIRTSIVLDREVRSHYSFVAIPLSGANIRVAIKVKDENDNAPEFPFKFRAIEFPENTPRDMKRTLNPAKDRDLGIYNTQRYEIVSGNVHNAFRLSSHRERDDILYLDLQINGILDREITPFYSLIIIAYDGGSPPLKGSMTVNITIQDVNDNQPIFNQSRYFATVAENSTVGTSILRVFATDTDAGDNGRVVYSINRRQSDRDNKFAIDPKTGVISVNQPLDFESKDVHELVVVARDKGAQPLETTAFVSIRVTDVNDNQPTINLIFLSDDASPKISEDARPGEFVARISVNDPDSREEYANVNVTLQGGDGHFGLTTQDNIIYLVIVSNPLDRETRPNYRMVVTATDQGAPPLNTSKNFELSVTDTNDNAPQFDQTVYYASVLEVADPGTSVFQLSAFDRDEGNNSLISYSIRNDHTSHSHWFQVDSATGLITTRTYIDCETDPIPQLTIIATDGGTPALSSSTTVVVTISDVNDNEPIFDQSFYNVTVLESEKVGTCILKVSATDPDCGVNAMVNYTMGGQRRAASARDFTVQPITGDLCIHRALDHETRTSYEIPILATDRGGLSTTAMIKVQVADANDNRPIFYPKEYNVSLQVGLTTPTSIIVVMATDADHGQYGKITYNLESGNKDSLFRIDSSTGEIFLMGMLKPDIMFHHLTVSAKDGGGLVSLSKAHVYISITNALQKPPVFDQSRYTFSVKEDSGLQAVVGIVSASTSDIRTGIVKYAIYSGDPEGHFSIDSQSGAIVTKAYLDHETRQFVLLNVQATSGHPPIYGHSQVNISIWDVNDNSPHFESPYLKISVPENAKIHSTIFVVYAEDEDSGNNSKIQYQLVENPDNMFHIGQYTGSISLLRDLDYEIRKHYVLIIKATDSGVPPRSSNMTLTIEVQDINDNAPVFDRTGYKVSILESLAANSQFLQVSGTDQDTGNNARLTYKITSKLKPEKFGIFPNSGFLYLKESLDREQTDIYLIEITAVDNGSPPLSTSTTVKIQVLDVNDNDPKFIKKNFLFSTKENQNQGILVGTVAANDKDIGNNASIRYNLINSNNSFQINPITGEIFSTVSLDREARAFYEFTVEAQDQGTPHRIDQAQVQIKVLDTNDNSPIFAEPIEKIIEVQEEQPVGTAFAQIQAKDLDERENGEITYEIIKNAEESDGFRVFEIDKKSGQLRTKKILDHEQQQLYYLTIVAKDNGLPSRQTTLSLQIRVTDVNDNQPFFPTSSLTFRLKEGIAIGYEVGMVQAHDKDGGENGRVLYSLIAGNMHGAFDISRTMGVIYTSGEIDFERESFYQLQVKAIDNNAINPHSSVITVNIEVEDLNDCAPYFKNDPILFSIPESTSLNLSIWNFTAIDLDSGVNSLLTYSIEQQSPLSVFKIDPKTGSLFLVKSLDYEAYPEYTIVVSATDQPSDTKEALSTTVTCRIIIEDENDNKPIFFSRNRVDILEDEPIDFPVIHIIAIDEDSRDNGRVTYEINSGNEKNHFALNYETGLLTINRPLDREIINHFALNITASDHGQPPQKSIQILDIYVEDINDNPPRFRQTTYKANLSETSPIGTYITKVEAFDLDIGENGNLTYLIPLGIANNKFTINATTGQIYTSAILDREEQEVYILSVTVKDGTFPAQYDTASVIITILDINDHEPDFEDSCYTLFVPENSEPSIIHTFLAVDNDSGENARITYSIAGGNIGNKFSIDPHSGQLSSKPLDREEIAHYKLTVIASDKGRPSKIGTCNLTITVLDQNDNDPQFEQSEYTATLWENVPINTSVVSVHALDKDDAINSKISYSINNETQSLFWIDSDTGIITTAGTFDREKKGYHTFEVRATDGGRYDARTEKVVVHVTILDVNDNRPMFSMFPFVATVSAHAAPGTQVIQLEASDKDEGANAEIVYSFVNSSLNGRFHLDSETGLVTVAGSLLADAGQKYHAEIIARDKGIPYKSATGMLEIHMADSHHLITSSLHFTNSSYHAQVVENSPVNTELIQVKALAPHGYQVQYSFSSGNEDSAFEIHPKTGVVRVKDPKQLDYESMHQINILVVAQTQSTAPIYGYSKLTINLLDQNDNPPCFSQERYVSSVWEGNNKGTFVTQVMATDEDLDGAGMVIYHIIEGNHDNAFSIDPPFSGIVKTNIVLDREIRETYLLTIIATDEGNPQLTGTCTLKISIIDVNDNQPVFPPHHTVTVSEGAEVGTVITTITANDVDTNPDLIYNFAPGGNPDNLFSIDRFSGRINLAQKLDHEKEKQHTLTIEVSDLAHIAETNLTVHVTDVNDNPPSFSQNSYQIPLPEIVNDGFMVTKLNATDQDSDVNALISYNLEMASVPGFCIEESTGVVYSNKTMTFNSKQPAIQLVISAHDHGIPQLSSITVLHLQVIDINKNAPKFLNNGYSLHLPEDTPRGSTVLKVSANDQDNSNSNHNIDYSVINGNIETTFSISGNTGEIILMKHLDREKVPFYTLQILAIDRGNPVLNSTTKVLIYIDDINDHPPLFNQTHYEISISEMASIGSAVLQVIAVDQDYSTITYDITSGNDDKKFFINSKTGMITIVESLDYDTLAEHRFIVRATDMGPTRPLSALAIVTIKLLDENDNTPYFPLPNYKEFVEENAPIGTTVFTIHAIDSDKGKYGRLNYSLGGEDKHKFHIDAESGLISTQKVFDYEAKSNYYLSVIATDFGGKSTSVQVQIGIESKDEYTPEFVQSSYKFTVPGDAPVGFVVGTVYAIDKDDGLDGRIVYHVRNPQSNLVINKTTGVITVKQMWNYEAYTSHDSLYNHKDVSLYVVASSGRPNSLSSHTVVDVIFDFSLNITQLGAKEEHVSGALSGWGIGLVVALVILVIFLLLIVFLLKKRTKKVGKPAVIQAFDNSFDTIDLHNPSSSTASLSQYPPHYNDIAQFDSHPASQHINGTTSEVSDQSHSASSGRGSAEEGEDVEDEEIRMINEGSRLQQQKLQRLGIPDSGIHRDDDNMSDISVQNTQEYLARLGISDTRSCQDYSSVEIFEDEGGGDGMDINNLIYSKLSEMNTGEHNGALLDGTSQTFGFGDEGEPSMTGSLSSIVHSEEELSGSYNWDYLLDWGPQYQPLAHVFAEIARLKDDNVTYGTKTLHPQIKTIPPPLITNIAPCSIAPKALNTSHLSFPTLPRSPIGHDSTFSSPAMSPSFSPALSPLATRSPSISPLVSPSLMPSHHPRGNSHSAVVSTQGELHL